MGRISSLEQGCGITESRAAPEPQFSFSTASTFVVLVYVLFASFLHGRVSSCTLTPPALEENIGLTPDMDGEQVTCPEVTGGTNSKDILQRCSYLYKSENQMRKFCIGLKGPQRQSHFFPTGNHKSSPSGHLFAQPGTGWKHCNRQTSSDIAWPWRALSLAQRCARSPQ